MIINMDESKLRTIEQIERFLAGNSEIGFSGYENDVERYAHLSRVLKRFDYPRRNKRERGVLLTYLRRTSGYSRAQLTRLVARWHTNRKAATPLSKRYSAPTAPFKRKYLAADIALLVEMDKANDNVCGPATAHLLKRAYQTYGDARYQRLASLSVSHLYNLRKSAGYRAQRTHFTQTHPVRKPIGVRRAPRPNGRAGFIRIDSVHQGDQDGVKGVYHITCVDEVSQWHVEACVQGISEAFLLLVLASIMAQFPFEIVGFHSDNGSEYINAKVAKLLSKLHIEQTKSRPRHSNDNALAESKNGSVVRKHMGYSHIPQQHAEPINHFYQQCFNPWLNLHRPSMFATEIVSPKGKIIKRYKNKDVKTPLECLVLLDKQGLVNFKTSATLTALLFQSNQMTDLMAAQQMQRAKSALFKGFANPKNTGRKNNQRGIPSISPRTAAGRLESAFNNRST
jgi:transposase InsO family protein